MLQQIVCCKNSLIEKSDIAKFVDVFTLAAWCHNCLMAYASVMLNCHELRELELYKRQHKVCELMCVKFLARPSFV